MGIGQNILREIAEDDGFDIKQKLKNYSNDLTEQAAGLDTEGIMESMTGTLIAQVKADILLSIACDIDQMVEEL